VSPDAITAGVPVGPDLLPLFGWALFTVLALVVTVVTGIRGMRGPHYAWVIVTLAGLAVAIRVAGDVGSQLVFEGLADTAKTIHFWAVGLDFLVLPIAAISGIRLARASAADEPGRRALHRKAAWALVVLLVITVILGTTMTLTASPKI